MAFKEISNGLWNCLLTRIINEISASSTCLMSSKQRDEILYYDVLDLQCPLTSGKYSLSLGQDFPVWIYSVNICNFSCNASFFSRKENFNILVVCRSTTHATVIIGFVSRYRIAVCMIYVE